MRRVLVKSVVLMQLCIINTYAEQTTTGTKLAIVTPTTVEYNNIKKSMIDIAGKQRMLSQRIAKDYLYESNKFVSSKAQKDLKKSIDEFQKNLDNLIVSIHDADNKNMLDFVKMSFDDFKEIIKKPYNLDNAQIALDLSESILEGSQYVVDGLENKSSGDKKGALIVAKSGKQRMLSQRIAKYYIAYQIGIKDKNSIDQMKATVDEFFKNHKELMTNPNNTPKINQKLHEVDKLWKIVYKFYLDIEKGGLPFIVYKTTNDITKKMDEITRLYVQK